MPSSLPFFSTLTLDVLAAWAGESVFQRGRAYHKAGRIRDIVLAPEGGLLATVEGTRKYATLIFQKENGRLDSLCTCPYGARCKHAVALACAGLALLDGAYSIPLADANDKRLLNLKTSISSDDASQDERDFSPQKLEAKLKTFSKKRLIDLVMQAVRLAPEVTALCFAKTEPQPKDALSLVKNVRKAMRKALEEPDWDYNWYSPDYEPVRKQLETLRRAGFPAEVLDLGLELLDDSMSQIEVCDDEGETHDAVAGCMEIILQALRDMNWPSHKKLLWAADAILIDNFAVCDCFWDLLREKYAPEVWSPVADILLQRLAQYGGEKFSRRALVGMAVHALTAAGRETEVVNLYKREAVHSGEYLPLVQYLLKNDADKKAEEWIHKGIAAKKQKEPHIAERLRSYLLELRKKQNDWDSVLCMQTEDFVNHASLDQFKECRSSAESLKVWPILRPLLVTFLIERKIPWRQDTWPCRDRGKASVFKGEKHPDFRTLIALFIDEKNPAEVLKWYDVQRRTESGYGYNADSVAAAVRDYAPERAIALWKELAEAQIALVKPSAYVEAAGFLRKMGKLMREHNMKEQWNACIQSLRNAHRRKPRLMEVLDSLSPAGKQIAHQHEQGRQ